MTHHDDVIILSLNKGVQKTRSKHYSIGAVCFLKMALLSLIKPYFAYIQVQERFSKLSDVRKLSIRLKRAPSTIESQMIIS